MNGFTLRKEVFFIKSNIFDSKTPFEWYLFPDF